MIYFISRKVIHNRFQIKSFHIIPSSNKKKSFVRVATYMYTCWSQFKLSMKLTTLIVVNELLYFMNCVISILFSFSIFASNGM